MKQRIIPFPITTIRREKIRQYLEHLTEIAVPMPDSQEHIKGTTRTTLERDSDLTACLGTHKAINRL